MGVTDFFSPVISWRIFKEEAEMFLSFVFMYWSTLSSDNSKENIQEKNWQINLSKYFLQFSKKFKLFLTLCVDRGDQAYIFHIYLQTIQRNYTKLKLYARILLPNNVHEYYSRTYLPNFRCVIITGFDVIIHFPNNYNTYMSKWMKLKSY